MRRVAGVVVNRMCWATPIQVFELPGAKCPENASQSQPAEQKSHETETDNSIKLPAAVMVRGTVNCS